MCVCVFVCVGCVWVRVCVCVCLCVRWVCVGAGVFGVWDLGFRVYLTVCGFGISRIPPGCVEQLSYILLPHLVSGLGFNLI